MSQRSRPPDGRFPYRHPIEVRFADTDALGHVNNAVYLSYFEAARAGYYHAMAGTPFGQGDMAARHTFLIAEAHVAWRTPAFFGETLWCECRVSWVSRSSFGLEYRLGADVPPDGPMRHVADGDSVQVMFDLTSQRVMRVPPDLLELIDSFEGRPVPRRRPG